MRLLPTLLLLISASLPADGHAQWNPDTPLRPLELRQIAVGNMLVGGVTAAARAVVGKRDPVPAFLTGAVGGALQFAGKYVAAGSDGTRAAISGLVLGSLGTSVIVNAGRGVSPWQELYLPVGPLRVRYTADCGVRLGVNLYESVLLGYFLTRSDLEIDRLATRLAAAPVFRDRAAGYNARYVGTSNAVTIGSIILLKQEIQTPGPTVQHETIHSHQMWFLQEAIGRPIDEFLRRQLDAAWLPEWAEPGLGFALLEAGEWTLWGPYHGPLTGMMEKEAERFERR